jgi:DNA-binding HxlR family transcriptional regulator
MHYMIAIKVKILILNRLNHLNQLFSKLGGRIIGIIERILTYRLFSPDFRVRTYIGNKIRW